MFDLDQRAVRFVAFDRARFQLHIHVIGDRATRVALDRIEWAREANGPWPSLHQLAHVQVIDPADIPRLRALGVVAIMQVAVTRQPETAGPDHTVFEADRSEEPTSELQ